MTVIEWDKVGDRVYQTGVDRGVLYLADGTAVPWNGLTSIEDNTSSELKSYYLDGIKILDHVSPGDFSGKLSAFTYPDEFEQALGQSSYRGLSYYDQPPKSFNLTYRTLVGNDVDGIDYAYKIHLLYNLVAVADSQKYDSIKDQASANEFSWSLSGTPPALLHNRPTVHISIDSRNALPEIVQAIEDILYGTDVDYPRFPTIDEIRTLFGTLGVLFITDNGDDTWTADDAGNDYITMLTDTEFQIQNADIVIIDPDTYQISTTNL